MTSSVDFLGHVLDADGLHVGTENAVAIRDAPEPTSLRELSSFLGIVTFYKFIPNASTLRRPLYDLKEAGREWHWDKSEREAFQKCKKLLTGSAVLVPYSMTLPLRLTCDASPFGAGAVLSHVIDNGGEEEERPVSFASKTFSATERRWAQTERESAAIIFGLKKFHNFLYGRSFEIVTDRRSLEYIFGSHAGLRAITASKLQRWAVLLGAYDYKIKYRPAEAIQHADALSRSPIPDETDLEHRVYAINWMEDVQQHPITAAEIADATRTDAVLARVMTYTQRGWPAEEVDSKYQPYKKHALELSVEYGRLLWRQRLVVPESLRRNILELLHDQHPGMFRMKSLARGFVWWPSVDLDVEAFVAACNLCQKNRRAVPDVPDVPWTWPVAKWERIHVDFAHFAGVSFLVGTDAHSKWPEVQIMANGTDTEETIEAVRGWFSRWGLPRSVVSDNGPPFQSELWERFLRNNGVKMVHSPPRHPKSNGSAERLVQSFKSALQKAVEDPMASDRSMEHRVNAFLMAYRNTPHSITSLTPAEMFLSRKPRTRLSLLDPIENAKRSVDR